MTYVLRCTWSPAKVHPYDNSQIAKFYHRMREAYRKQRTPLAWLNNASYEPRVPHRKRLFKKGLTFHHQTR